jgi:hypothetical protein
MALLDYYLEGRRFEWIMTVAMLWLAVAMAVSPRMLRASEFQFVTLVMSPLFVASMLFAIGWMRMLGLLLNGYIIRGCRLGPVIRSASAIGGAVMWVQFALALVQLSISQGFMSPGVPFWSIFVLGELDVAYRAVRGNGRGT